MRTTRMLLLVVIGSLLSGSLWGADVILNEYNAVDSAEFLNGGNSAADESGGRAFDSYFGRVEGNGGDWFELVVIKDHLDMRRWKLDIYEDKKFDKTLNLTNDVIWSDLRSGTIITVAEDVPSDVGYNPAGGDWWINVQANDQGDGLYIDKSNFKVSSKDWQLAIRDATGALVFGPAGEGVRPLDGVSGTNVFKLRGDPSASITPTSNDYGDGSDLSTFGESNRWGAQDFNDLRPKITPVDASIEVLAPNDVSVVASAGTVMIVKWKSTGITETVLIEFSTDGGDAWSPVYPPNVGNTGQYRWLVPLVESDLCLIRVSSSTRLSMSDVSDGPFVILADIPVACLTDGLASLLSSWLR
ncbi:MAG: hypothetical protein JW955_15900 [Sedimentisphaerales bacterium]|nr:hypothetical protein [Sedimentisphaerales bacterium]